MSVGTAAVDVSSWARAEAGSISQAGEQRSVRVESLRAVAALSVLVGHVYSQHLGFQNLFAPYSHTVGVGLGLSVSLFFVLSGYLLFLPWARQIRHGRRVDIRRYARNRALRILPLYYAVVVILFIVSPPAVDRGDWWRAAFFLVPYGHGMRAWLDDPMWSLAVEMQFYIVLPFLGWALVRLARGRLGVAAALLGVSVVVSFALRVVRVHHADHRASFIAGQYSLSTLFFYFATGMLLALLTVAWSSGAPRWARGRLGTPWAWVLAAVAGWLVVCGDYNGREWLLPIAGFLLVGACVLPLRASGAMRAFELRPLALLGVISYSVYLWQSPLIYVTGRDTSTLLPDGTVRNLYPVHGFPSLLLVTVPLVLLVSAVSYNAIEKPFLRLRRRWA